MENQGYLATVEGWKTLGNRAPNLTKSGAKRPPFPIQSRAKRAPPSHLCKIPAVKYVPSALLGQLSKSQGSTTASRNRFGSYLRNRVQPVNPNTSNQTAQRAVLAAASEQWRGLTVAQRAGWTALGLQMTRQDSLGQTYTLTGLQAFTSVYRVLTLAGAATLTDAPVLTAPVELTSVTVTATGA